MIEIISLFFGDNSRYKNNKVRSFFLETKIDKIISEKNKLIDPIDSEEDKNEYFNLTSDSEDLQNFVKKIFPNWR